MSLTQTVIKGGSSLLIRQIVGLFLNFFGMTFLARFIGPTEYGKYITALAITLFVYRIAQLGISTYLTRFGDELPVHSEHQAFILSATFGVAGAVILFIFAAVLDSPWTTHHPIFVIFAAGVFFQLLTTIPLASLERTLQYGLVARVELVGQLLFYIFSIPLALFASADAWVVAIGWLAQQIALMVLCYFYSPFHPKWIWNRTVVRDIIFYGVAHTSAEWIWTMRNVIAALMIGSIAGQGTLGVIAMAQKLIDSLGFARVITNRMAIPVLGQATNNPATLLHALNEVVPIQIIVNGLAFFAFALLGPIVIDHGFGRQWQDVLIIFPWLAIGSLVHCMFCLHSPILYVFNRNFDVGVFHLVNVILLMTGVYFFLPSFGIMGYGLAELLTTMSFAFAHFFLSQQLDGGQRYGLHALFVFAFGLAVFWPRIMGVVMLLVIMLHPQVLIPFANGIRLFKVSK